MPYWKWLGKSQPCLTLTLNQLLENIQKKKKKNPAADDSLEEL